MDERIRRTRRPRDKARAPDVRYWDYPSYDPHVPGTDLIMRVYEVLQVMGIPFYFSYYFGDALFTTGLKENVRVHFYIPHVNLAIILAGNYWFEHGDNLNETAMDVAMLQYAGINTMFITEDEIMRRGVAEILMSNPLLRQPSPPGEVLHTDYPPLDYRAFVINAPHPFRKQRMVKYRSRRLEKR